MVIYIVVQIEFYLIRVIFFSAKPLVGYLYMAGIHY